MASVLYCPAEEETLPAAGRRRRSQCAEIRCHRQRGGNVGSSAGLGRGLSRIAVNADLFLHNTVTGTFKSGSPPLIMTAPPPKLHQRRLQPLYEGHRPGSKTASPPVDSRHDPGQLRQLLTDNVVFRGCSGEHRATLGAEQARCRSTPQVRSPVTQAEEFRDRKQVVNSCQYWKSSAGRIFCGLEQVHERLRQGHREVLV
ncbi:hypothetical protein HPP92_029064 [Vanilla planifolia]|uniref:Uncharacterized protein n=1 Tax=Vanilla planifolia TaxID=51239 RepID=A0A835U1I4_VANPL|nr:hypothetical protein HPP92_029053 [Vanilla planifolia]KAG0445996.1 hypothetical protein HPP92_029064 [Vanilla planifolia]